MTSRNISEKVSAGPQRVQWLLWMQFLSAEGEYFMDRVIFPLDDYESRSDEIYALCQENNQQYPSSLLGSIPFFTAFPPDAMHLVYLGVTKRLFHYYFTNVSHLRLSCRVPPSQVMVLSSLINEAKKHFPKEFNRSIRSLNELAHYKAS